jgi:uncharacterized protein (TIGR02996 family)
MADEATFLAGLLADPDDDELRSVFADWLEEQSDLRAELVRVVIALRRATDPADVTTLLARLQQLRESVSPNWLAAVDRMLDEDLVREAVFREQLLREPLPCFLKVEKEQDPSPELMGRLQVRHRDIQPYSARASPLFTRRFGNGPVLTVGKIRWRDRTMCEVEGSRWSGPMSAQGFLYSVLAQGIAWVVAEVRRTWIA